MRAYVLTGPDAPPAFGEIPEPTPGEGEVLVRVGASSVNPHDAQVASGAAARYMTYRYPVVLGSDLAGVVEAVGPGVSDLAPGDRVFGLVRERVASRGSFADLVAVPREWVVPTPGSADDRSAGALGLAALTAWRSVGAIDPKAGDVVLVNGAAGGVGGYAVQMLAARDVRVIGTARDGDQEKYVRDLGAAETVDWTGADLATVVRDRHPNGIAAVIDLVNRDQTVLTALAAAVLHSGGRVVSTGHAADPEALPGVRAMNMVVEVDQSALRSIAELVGNGSVRAPITRSFLFEEIEAAFDALSTGVTGKIAVQP